MKTASTWIPARASDPKWKRLFFTLLFLVVGLFGEGAIFLDWVGLISGRPSVIWWIYKSIGFLGLTGAGFFGGLALSGRAKNPKEEEG